MCVWTISGRRLRPLRALHLDSIDAVLYGNPKCLFLGRASGLDAFSLYRLWRSYSEPLSKH